MGGHGVLLTQHWRGDQSIDTPYMGAPFWRGTLDVGTLDMGSPSPETRHM